MYYISSGMIKPCLIMVISCSSLFHLIFTELRFVFTMTRHGARAPLKHPIDAFNEEWEQDRELTAVGMRQSYLLGYRNRQKYKNFLSDSINMDEIYVASTDVNRTILSAFAHIQGLYPPHSGALLNSTQILAAIPPFSDVDFQEEINQLGLYPLKDGIQAVPIHLFDAHGFHSLRLICWDKYTAEKEKRIKMQKAQNILGKFNSQYGSALRQMNNISDANFIFDYHALHLYADTFYCDLYEKKQFKSLINAGVDLKEFYKSTMESVALDAYEVNSGNSIISTMLSSPTALEILNWMTTRIQFDMEGKGYAGYGSPKFVLYSMHDYDISAMMIYMREAFDNIFKDESDYVKYYPGFASALYFELHCREKPMENRSMGESDYYVSISFNDNQLFNMTFSDFKEKVKLASLTNVEISRMCGLGSKSTARSYFIFFAIFFLIISLIELLIIVRHIVKHNISDRISTNSNEQPLIIN